MTVLQPQEAYRLLAAEYDTAPNALIALERGWKRTFRHNGGVIEIAHEAYRLEDLQAPSLTLTCLMEPRLGLPEKAIFDQAGCPERFEIAARWPAIFVAQFIRTAT